MNESSPLERGRHALDWYLIRARQRGEGLTDEEIHAELGSQASPNMIRGIFRQRRDLVGCRLTSEPVEEEPGRVAAQAVTEDGTPMRAVAVVRADGNIYVMISKALPEGFSIRIASEVDGPGLAGLCRRCPIVVGDTQTTIDYGEDYLQATEVANDRLVLLVEYDGTVVGLHSCVFHQGAFGHEEHLLAYLRHTRIDPSLQRAGVFSALNSALFERSFPSGANAYSLVAVGNANMLAKLPEELRRWPWLQTRFLVDTYSVAGGETPLDEVEPGDAAQLVNAAHAGAAISPPASTESMRRRFELLYDSKPPRGTAEAMIGVSHRPLRITTSGPHGVQVRTQVVALDLGARSADAFITVLRAWCTRLADEGIDDLAIDLSTASPLHGPTEELAHSARNYAVQIAIPPPPGVAGFRVDAALI